MVYLLAVGVMSLIKVIGFLMPMSVAIDPNCDFYQDIQLGQTYYIYNPGYPNLYSGGISCRWLAVTQPNTQIVLSCEDIDLPASTNCQQDRLSISQTGSTTFQDAHNYCGRGTLSQVSDSTRMSIGLFSAWYSTGGRFLCTITSIQSQFPTTSTPAPPVCDCGWKQQRRIVGGIETGINEYPSMAALIHLQRRDLHCGASIISVKYGLTAAHCLEKLVPSNLALLVGDHDLSTGNDTASAALYAIDRFITHPNYNNRTQENDIAVVRTQRIIVFSADVGPICLPFRYSTQAFTGATVTALGWGLLETTGMKSNTLQEVDLTVVANERCQEELQGDTIYLSEICTFGRDKDACQFDSGGPILWLDTRTRRLQLVGVISFGRGCGGDNPGVNSRVTSFLAWIVSVTSDAEYCIK